MPRSMPCTATCSGTVTRDGKNRNWVAHRVQNARLRRTSASSGAPAPERSLGERLSGDRLSGGCFIDRAAANSSTAAATPSTSTALRHPRPTIRSAVSGGSTIWPVAVPTFTTPVIVPRLRSNQRAMVESVTTSWVLRPSPMKIPNSATSCQGSPITEMRPKPIPYSNPVVPSTAVGPYRSLRRPAEERQHSHDQNGQGGAARQQRSRPAELVFEDVEEQSDREQQAHDRELRHAGADDHRVSRVHCIPVQPMGSTSPGARARGGVARLRSTPVIA